MQHDPASTAFAFADRGLVAGRPARIGILLSGAGSTYVNLAKACADGRIDGTIAVVIASKSGLPGIDRAAELGHPCVIASKPDAVTAALLAASVDVVAMCGWLKFYDPPAALAGRVLNIHPSLLPRHGGRGMYGHFVHEAVIAAGDTESGCTIHVVAGQYDSGPVLAQARVPVPPGDTPTALAARVQAAERALYPAVLSAYLAGGVAAARTVVAPTGGG